MNSQITDFVHDALQRGVSREDIHRGLLTGGWSPKEINAALDAYVECDLPLPVPRKRVSGSAKEAFLFLMLFSAMYATVIALSSVLFDLINIYMPDPGEQVDRWIVSLRNGMATVIVAFPIFLFMGRVVHKETIRNPGQRISPVRRWLTYLTLFVASASLITDLIVLIVRYLSGDLTIRFGLKVLVVAVIAGTVFFYYLRDLKQDEEAPSAEYTASKNPAVARIALIAGVLIVLGFGFWSAGSPMTARLYSQDARRIRDLAGISQRVQLFYLNQGALPESLDACNVNPETNIEQKEDRVTGTPYEYRILDETRFELGATFAMPSQSGGSDAPAGANPPYGPARSGFWLHDRGRATFVIDATRKRVP